MKNGFSQLDTLPLSDRVAQQVEEAIVSGRYRPGERINTDELARKFKVSHIPIREALKKLAALGLIVPEANKSARVLELSLDEVGYIFEVRKVLEGLAISLAAKRIDAGSQRRLQALVKKMDQTAKSKNFAGMFAADKKFHETIWHLCGNPILIKALTTLLMPYFCFLATTAYYHHMDDLSYVPRVHEELLKALSSGNGERAKRILVDVHDQAAQAMLSRK